MRNRFIALFAASVGLVLIASPALAHHSMSMYDLDHLITLRGTVTDFIWSNPHAQVHFDVQDDKGGVGKWTADCPSPRRLSRAGWTADTLKAGEQVTIIGNHAKDGSMVMRLDQVVLSSGQELTGYSR